MYVLEQSNTPELRNLSMVDRVKVQCNANEGLSILGHTLIHCEQRHRLMRNTYLTLKDTTLNTRNRIGRNHGHFDWGLPENSYISKANYSTNPEPSDSYI